MIRRAAIAPRAGEGANTLGAVESSLAIHPTHRMRAGACTVCGVRATWPRIEGRCGNVHVQTSRERRPKKRRIGGAR